MKRYFLAFFLLLFAVSSLYIIKNHSRQEVCANSLSCKTSLTLDVENGSTGVFNNQQITAPDIDLADQYLNTKVLGEATLSGEKRILVDLTTQTLSAYQGDTLVLQTYISTGKWFPTPTGEFKVWIKLRATRMTGGEGADFYDLPNVPYVMFFYNDKVSKARGFSLHGAYWHNNFGHPMSHGCVNMRTIDAMKLYNFIDPGTEGNITYATEQNPGTKVIIYGQAPL